MARNGKQPRRKMSRTGPVPFSVHTRAARHMLNAREPVGERLSRCVYESASKVRLWCCDQSARSRSPATIAPNAIAPLDTTATRIQSKVLLYKYFNKKNIVQASL